MGKSFELATALAMIGKNCSDLLSDFKGCVTSIEVDVYGNIQLRLTSENDEKWLNLKRVKPTDGRSIFINPYK